MPSNRITRLLARFQPHGARLWEALGRIVYPPHCAACGNPTGEDEDRYLCRDCIAAIDFTSDDVCHRCGHELGPFVIERARCEFCRDTPLRFDRAFAASHHRGIARDLVLGLKFGRQKHHIYPMALLLAGRINDTDIVDRIDAIVPVPLHRTRLRRRGFNQADLLARELGHILRVPVGPWLLRIKDTPPQTMEMSMASRRANVKGAFAPRRPKQIVGKTILLIDDVMTTGATASECAGTLKRAGAEAVYVLTLTRRMSTPPIGKIPRPRYRSRTAVPVST